MQVSGKLIDKERDLEDEIQQRERLQLQCKQAERTVDDLHMELQTANQAREDVAKQLKTAQVRLLLLLIVSLLLFVKPLLLVVLPPILVLPLLNVMVDRWMDRWIDRYLD